MKKPKLLVIELWGVGDLAIATPFLRKISEKYDVTLLSKSYAIDLQQHFMPLVMIAPFNAPWTAFKGKYRILSWPWRTLFSIVRQLHRTHFDVALSARWDPRDHLLLWLTGAKMRLGFPRTGSRIFLTNALTSPNHAEHRYEYWRAMAQGLGVDLEPRNRIQLKQIQKGRVIFVHTGAGQPVRVWPLQQYRNLVQRLREHHYSVKVVCNPEQREWWLNAGEKHVETPQTITDLLHLMEGSAAFLGNDSGPGHLAAFCGIPTFTFFGPQVPEWFVPLHPAAEWSPGKACPYKPCSDSCRFPTPFCLQDVTCDEVWPRVQKFVQKFADDSPLAPTHEAT
ncbi:glycosyltransferase family 9 protein [Pedosphaera parvula]|uniref:Glycosyl transferase family 9 n=1 Tax=Pedosphaera parvula (strain Ellin514) TaxID=320771 RepID=B9XSC2_PEDPL|nr:glycosyltransferase family 9 protein [Pedosphaera parvula]EEF57255.1 glycosyl transferase family 9 [Pedosphaera parvula Ellin514]